jgi:hypothetical protein
MAQSLDNLSRTWSDAGTTFTAVKYNITDSGSAAGSLLMDLQVGGASRFKVQKNGAATFNVAGFDVGFLASGLDVGTYAIFRAAAVSFGPGNDVSITRDTADTLAQRRGANGQTFRLYNTYTDASNHERGKIEWSSNVLRIGTEKAGSGTARALEFQTDGTTRLTINSSGNTTLTGALTIGAAASFSHQGRVLFSSPAAGIYTLQNNTQTDWDRLQFGGTTSSFPALKRSSTSLIVRLADDTANAPLESASVKTDAPAGGTSGTWKLGVAATVSPTSPDRTIEVDIGGTIYYIAAKTTND